MPTDGVRCSLTYSHCPPKPVSSQPAHYAPTRTPAAGTSNSGAPHNNAAHLQLCCRRLLVPLGAATQHRQLVHQLNHLKRENKAGQGAIMLHRVLWRCDCHSIPAHCRPGATTTAGSHLVKLKQRRPVVLSAAHGREGGSSWHEQLVKQASEQACPPGRQPHRPKLPKAAAQAEHKPAEATSSRRASTCWTQPANSL